MSELNDFLNLLSEAKAESIKKETQFSEKIKSNNPFMQLLDPDMENKIPSIIEPTPEVVLESIEIVQEKLVPDILNPANYDKLFKSNVNLFDQPKLPAVNPEFKALTDKVQYMENWLTKISMTGPGGGAAEIYNLETPVKTITGDYTIGRRDYYIGVVTATKKIYITLPNDGIKQGRIIIIKDESGNSSIYPIIVQGMVDNDPDGFRLQINRGSIQLIYNNGWRII
jgi:hypothetical protein